jgi:Ca2+-binding RTX toxin-like protein
VSIENVIGSAYSDEIRGDDLANRVWGGSGDDAVDLAAGDDSVRGGPGTDLGDGGAGTDSCVVEVPIACE